MLLWPLVQVRSVQLREVPAGRAPSVLTLHSVSVVPPFRKEARIAARKAPDPELRRHHRFLTGLPRHALAMTFYSIRRAR